MNIDGLQKFADDFVVDVLFKVTDNAGNTILNGDMQMLSDFTVGAIIEDVAEYLANKGEQHEQQV